MDAIVARTAKGDDVKAIEITYRYDDSPASIRPRPADAEAARERLDEGNRTFAALVENLDEDAGTARRIIAVDPRDLGLHTADDGAPKQRPYAAILGCADARVPVELIFSEGPNGLFVVRVAGNGLGSEVLGSLNYAVDHLGGSLKLIVVLGHSGCGALSAAVDVFLNPEAYLALADKHALRNILDRLLVVVHAAAKKLAVTFGPEVTRRRGYREALIESAVVLNAALASFTVQQEIGNRDSQGLRAAYGVYLLSTRQIWAPRCASAACDGLAYPPPDRMAFADLAEAIVHSERIASLLEHGDRLAAVARPAGCAARDAPVPAIVALAALAAGAWLPLARRAGHRATRLFERTGRRELPDRRLCVYARRPRIRSLGADHERQSATRRVRSLPMRERSTIGASPASSTRSCRTRGSPVRRNLPGSRSSASSMVSATRSCAGRSISMARPR